MFKVNEGRPHIVDKLIDREIDLVFNTTSGKKAIGTATASAGRR